MKERLGKHALNKITFGFVKILETKMLPHSQDSKTSSSTQSGIIKIGPKIGSNSRSFEHPSVQTVQLKVSSQFEVQSQIYIQTG